MTDRTKEILLSQQGSAVFRAIVDEADYPRVSSLRWSHTNGYACRKEPGNIHQSMHRFILGLTGGDEVDHVNGDGLDNRRANLRVCSRRDNVRNKSVSSNNKCGYKGVSHVPYGKRVKRWVAKININGRQKHLGYFSRPDEAAEAYNKAAVELFGRFARLNIVTNQLDL